MVGTVRRQCWRRRIVLGEDRLRIDSHLGPVKTLEALILVGYIRVVKLAIHTIQRAEAVRRQSTYDSACRLGHVRQWTVSAALRPCSRKFLVFRSLVEVIA